MGLELRRGTTDLLGAHKTYRPSKGCDHRCTHPLSAVFTMKKQATHFRANKLYLKNTKCSGDSRCLLSQVCWGEGHQEWPTLCRAQAPPPPPPKSTNTALCLVGGGKRECRVQSRVTEKWAMAFPCSSRK